MYELTIVLVSIGFFCLTWAAFSQITHPPLSEKEKRDEQDSRKPL